VPDAVAHHGAQPADLRRTHPDPQAGIGEARLDEVDDLILALGLSISGRSTSDVAEELARFDEVCAVNIVSGEMDLEVLILSEDHESLREFVGTRLAGIAGIRQLSPSLTLEVFKFDQGSTHNDHPPNIPLSEAGSRPRIKGLDNVDRRILEALWEDARQSHQAIADHVGVTEGTVRGRLKRLFEEGAVRVTTRDLTGLDSQVLAYLWMTCDRKGLREIAHSLAQDENVVYVASLFGRADVMAIVVKQSHAEVVEYVDEWVKAREGVSDVRVEPILKTLISDMRWGILHGASDDATGTPR